MVDAVVKHFEDEKKNGGKVAGQPIRDLVTVNGVRVTVDDGTWGLVRASSNKPELVVVVESRVSEVRMRQDGRGRSMPCCAPTRRSGSIIRKSEDGRDRGRRTDIECDKLSSVVCPPSSDFLINVDLQRAAEHGAPGLQIGLQAHIAPRSTGG